MRLILRLRDPGAEPARMRQRPHQHMRLGTPRRGRQLQPVPLHLGTRGMSDVGRGAALHPGARFTMRPQPALPQLTGERLIRPLIPQGDHFVEQGRRPHVTVVRQPLAHVRLEPVERVLHSATPYPRRPFASQVGADGLAVPAHVAGDRRDRPALLPQRVDLHILSLCQHQARAPLLAGRSLLTASLERAPTPIRHLPQPQGWGNSVSRSGEFQMSAVPARRVVNRSCGVCHPRVLRGRRLSSSLTRARSSAVWTRRFVPLGK